MVVILKAFEPESRHYRHRIPLPALARALQVLYGRRQFSARSRLCIITIQPRINAAAIEAARWRVAGFHSGFEVERRAYCRRSSYARVNLLNGGPQDDVTAEGVPQ